MIPLISVVIPSYNNEKYIKETINSIISQSYENLELIIIDDGSTDNSYGVAQEVINYAKKRFFKIVLEQHKHSGIISSLNKALNIASGEYLYFIASDDVAKPDAIEVLYQHIIRDNYVLAVGDNEIIGQDSNKISWDKNRNILPYNDPNGFQSFWRFILHKRKDSKAISKKFGSYFTLLKGNYILNGILVKTEVIRQTGGYTEEAPLEDWYMNLQLAKLGKFIFVDKILFSYRWHGKNISLDYSKMRDYVRKTILYEYKNVNKNDSAYYLNLFNSYFFKKRIILDLKIVKIIKRRDLFTQCIVLVLLNKEIIVSNKKYVFKI